MIQGKYIFCTAFLASFGFSVSDVQAVSKDKRPNILFIAVDDCNTDLGSAFGCRQAVTPNLDRLMQHGVSFVNCHTPASFSTPTRTSLMTGMAPWRSGCYENQPHLFNIPDRITLDELLHESGYETFGGGKIYHHMPGYVNLEGFDEYYLWNENHKKAGWKYGAWDDSVALPGTIPLGELGKAVYDQFDVYPLADSLESKMADTRTVDWAIDVLGREHDRPFFLAVGLYAPHKPNYCPEKYFRMHPFSEIEIPDEEADYFSTHTAPAIARYYKGRINRQHINGVKTVKDGWAKAIQGYLACISYADAQIGRILDKLAESEYADNTVIIFWSDNGYHLGEKQLWAKHTCYSRTTNVPMIWAGPGIADNKVCYGVVSLMDIFPTIIDICGLQTSDTMDGITIRKILKSPGKYDPDRAVITCNRDDAYTISTRKWHYSRYTVSRDEELFDAENDPRETRNLASDSRYEDVLKRFRAMLPENPAPAGAEPGKGCRLVCEGETFRWVPVERKDRR